MSTNAEHRAQAKEWSKDADDTLAKAAELLRTSGNVNAAAVAVASAQVKAALAQVHATLALGVDGL